MISFSKKDTIMNILMIDIFNFMCKKLSSA